MGVFTLSGKLGTSIFSDINWADQTSKRKCFIGIISKLLYLIVNLFVEKLYIIYQINFQVL